MSKHKKNHNGDNHNGNNSNTEITKMNQKGQMSGQNHGGSPVQKGATEEGQHKGAGQQGAMQGQQGKPAQHGKPVQGQQGKQGQEHSQQKTDSFKKNK